MKRMILLVTLVVHATGVAFADGKEQHVIGTVTAMMDDSITVQTQARDHVTVYTMPFGFYFAETKRQQMKELKAEFIPAMSYRSLTRLYDPWRRKVDDVAEN
jgi:hypothetical protein